MLNSLAMTALTNDRQEYEVARMACEECLAITRQTGEIRREILIQQILGQIAIQQGNMELAKNLHILALDRSKNYIMYLDCLRRFVGSNCYLFTLINWMQLSKC